MTFESKNLLSAKDSPSNGLNFAQTVLEGLSLEQKCLPSWPLFDDRGSEIFKKITWLKGYPPAECEFEIIGKNKKFITDMLPEKNFRLIELGSGDGEKAKILIKTLIGEGRPVHYVPIDITERALKSLVASLESEFSGTTLKVTGLIADFFQGLDAVVKQSKQRNLVLFLGATLGNMAFEEMQKFLRKLNQALNYGDHVMIGFDLMKHPKQLYAAYNDSQGLFEEFNLYMLDRINKELDGNFNKENFVQVAQYNLNTRAVESYVYSTCEQTVRVGALDREFKFKAWEKMRTELSYKYTEEEIDALAVNSGFEIIRHLYEAGRQYVMPVWKAGGE